MVKWKKIRRQIRRPFETAGFSLLCFLIPLLPRRGIVALSRMAGRIALWLPLREKEIGMKNLDAVFGTTRTIREKRKILRSSFSTFTLTMLDLFWFGRSPQTRLPAYVDYRLPADRELLLQQRPFICITAHMGSWEVMGQALALEGAKVASIAAAVKNNMVDRMLIDLREQTGQIIIPQKGAMRTLIARLRQNVSAAFVLDQNTSRKKGGIEVDFLGLPTPVSPAPAALACRTGTSIAIGFCLPQPNGRYCIEFPHIIDPPADSTDRDHAVIGLTQQIQNHISDKIRSNPGYWLWAYKHWRREAGHTYPEHYPDYSS